MFMNKLTKIGVSALCGTLAAVSAAHAGSISVAGGAVATYTSLEGGVTGNPIGLNSGLTFTGTGELDNGTAFTLTITQTDAVGLSAANLNMDLPTLGGIKINAKSGGTGIDIIDDMMPTAWEETNGTGLNTGLATVAGVGAGINVGWSVGSDMLPEGLALDVAWSPRVTSGATSDKGVGGDSAGIGSGWDAVVRYSGIAGLNAFGGMSTIAQANGVLNDGFDGDRTQYAAGLTYAFGGITAGYQKSRDNLQVVSPGSASYYDNEAYAISFAVNDDLAISYGVHKSTKHFNDAGTTAAVENDAQSFQLSYTMGGASFQIAETSVDNGLYTSGTGEDKDGTTLRLSLAF